MGDLISVYLVFTKEIHNTEYGHFRLQLAIKVNGVFLIEMTHSEPGRFGGAVAGGFVIVTFSLFMS